MTLIGAKLAFAHRRLWQRDGTYRVAVLLGPPPLVGIALAAALWAGFHAFYDAQAGDVAPPPWAHPQRPASSVVAAPSRTAAPSAPLPEVAADGTIRGLEPGWSGGIQPIDVNPILDVDVLPRRLATFTLHQPDIDLGQIVAAGPATGLYVGVMTAAVAIRVAGLYALSVRVERLSDQPADCLARLGFAHQRLISNLRVNVAGIALYRYDPVEMELQPGLYPVAVAFGCWHDARVAGQGTLTILMRRPGEKTLEPARSDEILHPVAR